jgi:hypothetical protein
VRISSVLAEIQTEHVLKRSEKHYGLSELAQQPWFKLEFQLPVLSGAQVMRTLGDSELPVLV